MHGRHDTPLEEREFPDPADLDGGEDSGPDEEIGFCENCAEPVYGDSPRCPHCGQWFSVRRAGRSNKWYVRVGMYLVKTLLLNWLIWGLAGLAALLAIVWELLR